MEDKPIHNGSPNQDSASQQKNNAELEVRSAEVQEIIGRPPHWLIRGGTGGFLLVLSIIFIAATVIKYPDAISTRLEVSALNAPKVLQSRTSGKIVKLHYENNEKVEQDEVIAWLESTGDHQEVLELAEKVDSMRTWMQQNKLQSIEAIEIGGFSELGELQTNFQSFEQAYREFLTYLPGGFVSEQQKMLNQELEYNERLLEKLNEQKKIQEISLEVAQKEYDMQEQLTDRDLAAPIELERAKNDLASNRLPLKQTETSIINNQVSQISKKKEVMELNKQIKEQQSIFLQELNILKSAIDDWMSDYLVIAPIDGNLVYAGIFQENQNLESGERIGYIQPENTEFFGQMAVAQQSFGKIEEGQKVLVNFSGFPEQEYGTVAGEIDYLSSFPVQDSVFIAKVDFPDGFTTNYDTEIPPSNGMVGQAEIITQDMRLVERIYNNLTKELR